MVFSSPSFLFVFLPIALALYFAVRGMDAKNLVLLTLSLLFYAWGEPVMVGVMLGSIGFNYLAARVIDAREGRARLLTLWAAVAVNLLALAVFKYADFLAGGVQVMIRLFGWPPVEMKRAQIPLPLGVSFFTFHALSYLVDVYRRRFAANRRLRQVALYIAFFPQLIAGPIVRYRQIARRLAFRRHSWGRASAGLRLLVIGLAMKVLLADPLAPLAEAVFDRSPGPPLAAAWIGTAAYTLQIYFDFAGYSLMAVGLGVVFGFSLPRNFDQPYRSRSITEFWRRWHITLSAWFRDYLYIPLGGNRGGQFNTVRNLMITMLLGGLWHGAAWLFVIWGAWHGLLLAVWHVMKRTGLYVSNDTVVGHWANRIVTFFLVIIGWVFFRAADVNTKSYGLPSIKPAITMLKEMFGHSGWTFRRAPVATPLLWWFIAFSYAWCNFLPNSTQIAYNHAPRRRYAMAAGAVMAVCALHFGVKLDFLYFRF